MSNSGDQFNRLEDRFDSLSAKIDKNHAEVTKAIHEVELKVGKHENMFGILKYITPPGALLGVVAFFRDYWK